MAAEPEVLACAIVADSESPSIPGTSAVSAARAFGWLRARRAPAAAASRRAAPTLRRADVAPRRTVSGYASGHDPGGSVRYVCRIHRGHGTGRARDRRVIGCGRGARLAVATPEPSAARANHKRRPPSPGGLPGARAPVPGALRSRRARCAGDGRACLAGNGCACCSGDDRAGRYPVVRCRRRRCSRRACSPRACSPPIVRRGGVRAVAAGRRCGRCRSCSAVPRRSCWRPRQRQCRNRRGSGWRHVAVVDEAGHALRRPAEPGTRAR